MEHLYVALREHSAPLSQAKLAKHLGVTQKCLDFWRTGKRRPQFKALHLIITRFPDLEPEIVEYIKKG